MVMATVPFEGALGAACSDPLLALRDVRFGYGELEVLRGVDLEVAPGELVGLCGENGAGK